MATKNTARLTLYLPQVALATFVVAVCPILAVWALRAAGVVGSVFVAAALGVVLSLGASRLGGIYWERRSSSEDVLFADLMIWGWLQRWRIERRLDTALTLLGRHAGTSDLSPERRGQLLQQLAGALEARDPYTHGHSRRVARYSSMISERMGLSSDEVARIRTAAAVHDLGKINTPTEILHKRERLTDEEFAITKRHPVDGARMVEILGDEELTSIVRHHHERLDRSGYPNGLAGDAIPLGARIIAVADTFDAITSTRPYRRANPHKTAIDILTNEAGTQLDPTAVRAFRTCYSDRRPLALWSALSNVPERLFSWLGGSGSTASAVSITKVIATTATAAAVGSAAAGTALVATPDAAPSVELAADAGLTHGNHRYVSRSTSQGVKGVTARVVGTGSSARSGSSSPTGAFAGGPARTSRAGDTAYHERGGGIGQTPDGFRQGPSSSTGEGPVLGTRQSEGMGTGQALALGGGQVPVLGTEQGNDLGGGQVSGVNDGQTIGRDGQGGPRGGHGGPGPGRGAPGDGHGGPGPGHGAPGDGHGGSGHPPGNPGPVRGSQGSVRGGQGPGQDGAPGGAQCDVFTTSQDSIFTSSPDSAPTSGPASATTGPTTGTCGAQIDGLPGIEGAGLRTGQGANQSDGQGADPINRPSSTSGSSPGDGQGHGQSGEQGRGPDGGFTTGQDGGTGSGPSDGQGGGAITGEGGGFANGQSGGFTTGQGDGTGSGQSNSQGGGATSGQGSGQNSGPGGATTDQTGDSGGGQTRPPHR